MAGSKRCAKCKKSLGLEQFPLKIQPANGTTPSHTSTCFTCTEKKKAHRQKVQKQKLGQKFDLDSDEPLSDEEAPSDQILPGVLSLKDFLVFLGRQKDVLTVEARITVGELSEYDDRRKRADAIVNLMWEVMNYRFLYVSVVLFTSDELIGLILLIGMLVITVNMITSGHLVLHRATCTIVLRLMTVNMLPKRVKSLA